MGIAFRWQNANFLNKQLAEFLNSHVGWLDSGDWKTREDYKPPISKIYIKQHLGAIPIHQLTVGLTDFFYLLVKMCCVCVYYKKCHITLKLFRLYSKFTMWQLIFGKSKRELVICAAK